MRCASCATASTNTRSRYSSTQETRLVDVSVPIEADTAADIGRKLPDRGAARRCDRAPLPGARALADRARGAGGCARAADPPLRARGAAAGAGCRGAARRHARRQPRRARRRRRAATRAQRRLVGGAADAARRARCRRRAPARAHAERRDHHRGGARSRDVAGRVAAVERAGADRLVRGGRGRDDVLRAARGGGRPDRRGSLGRPRRGRGDRHRARGAGAHPRGGPGASSLV